MERKRKRKRDEELLKFINRDSDTWIEEVLEENKETIEDLEDEEIEEFLGELGGL
jgi:hypothetical protein